MMGRGHGIRGGDGGEVGGAILAFAGVMLLVWMTYYVGVVSGKRDACESLMLATTDEKVQEFCVGVVE